MRGITTTMFHWGRVLLAACCLGALLPITADVAGSRAPATPADQVETIVETSAGPVRGVTGEGYRLFQGIPYAAPPIGNLRWQAPQPVAPWTEPLDATTPGNWCPQPAGMPGSLGGGDEDCLYLNVTAPLPASVAEPKPVMVWIHGGGFQSGAGALTDPRRLAVAGEVVVVTINYRLGILGFFGYPGLAGSGAFGLEDQLAALRWVQQNAAAFGGDPGNVTLFGESAGGISACALLTSPEAEGLFHKAIIQSGSCLIDWPNNGMFLGVEAADLWASRGEVEGLGEALAAERGCADGAAALDCLRRLPAADLLAAPLAPAFGPAFDTDVLPENPATAMRAGEFQAMPVLIGATQDEARTFVSFGQEPITPAVYERLLSEAFGDDAAAVRERYPLDAFASPALAWATAMTDRVWVCPTLDAASLFADKAPTYVYEFADRSAPPLFPFPPELPGGAYHGAELAFLFDIPVAGFEANLTPDQQELAEAMIGYWANFARSGDPNGPGLPDWPPFDGGDQTPSAQSLAPGDDGIGPVDLSESHQCAFWYEGDG